MADESKQGLTEEELESQTGEALPDREAMSVVWIEPDVLPPPEKDVEFEYGLDNGTADEPLRGGEEL